MNKKFLKTFSVLGFLALQTISYGFPELKIDLQGPQELKFNFEGASIQAPRSSQSGNIASLEESQRSQPKTWVARRNNNILQTFDLELPNSTSSLNANNIMQLNFYKDNLKISQRPEKIDLNLENNEINIGEYTINVKVNKSDPGPNVKYNVQMTAQKNP